MTQIQNSLSFVVSAAPQASPHRVRALPPSSGSRFFKAGQLIIFPLRNTILHDRRFAGSPFAKVGKSPDKSPEMTCDPTGLHLDLIRDRTKGLTFRFHAIIFRFRNIIAHSHCLLSRMAREGRILKAGQEEGRSRK